MITRPLIFVCLSLAATNPADAAMSWQQRCEAMGGIAKTVMQNHQNRMPLSESLRRITDDPNLKPLLKRIVMRAYQEPRYATLRNQRMAAQEYADKTLLSCLNAEEGKNTNAR